MRKRLCMLLLVLLPWTAHADKEFYDLTFENIEGHPVHLSDYKGKVVLLNFWATWCPPCVREMPSMQRLQEHFSDQPFEIIAINAGETPDAIEAFLLELSTPLTFTLLVDQQNRAFQEFRLAGLPTSYLVDKEGQLLKVITGGREWDSGAQLTLIEDALEQ